MRSFLLTLAVVLGLMAIPAHHGAAIATGATLEAAASTPVLDQAAPNPPQINVEVNRGGGRWYASPVWIAIGIVALVVLVLLIVMASRGGGTTVVRG